MLVHSIMILFDIESRAIASMSLLENLVLLHTSQMVQVQKFTNTLTMMITTLNIVRSQLTKRENFPEAC